MHIPDGLYAGAAPLMDGHQANSTVIATGNQKL